MNLSRQRKFTINMGRYEGYSFGAQVTLHHYDLGYTDDDVAAMSDKERSKLREDLTDAVMEELNEQLREELEDAAYFTDEAKSLARRLIPEAQPEPPRARRIRRP